MTTPEHDSHHILSPHTETEEEQGLAEVWDTEILPSLAELKELNEQLLLLTKDLTGFSTQLEEE